MEFRAKTVEEAIEIGLNELGISKEDADIKILQKSGLLKKAVVEINKIECDKVDIQEQFLNPITYSLKKLPLSA